MRWEQFFDSPNGVEWQWTEDTETRLGLLNSTMLAFHHGNPNDPFDKKEELEQYENIKLQGDRWVGFEWVNNDARSQELGLKGEGAFRGVVSRYSQAGWSEGFT